MRMEPPPPGEHILRRLRDPLERLGFPWKTVATDRPGLPHLPLLFEADVDAYYVEVTNLADCRRRPASLFDYDGRAAEA